MLLFAILCYDRVSDRRARADAVRPLSGHGHYLADRRAGACQCRRRDGAVADERADPTVRQLWRVVAVGQSVGVGILLSISRDRQAAAGRLGSRISITDDHRDCGRRNGGASLSGCGVGERVSPARSVRAYSVCRDERGIESKVLAHEGFELVLITAKPVMGKELLQVLTGCAFPAGRPLAVLEDPSPTPGRSCDRPRRLYESDRCCWPRHWKVPRVILEPNAYPGMANKPVGPSRPTHFSRIRSAADCFSGRRCAWSARRFGRQFLGMSQRTRETKTGTGNVAGFRREPGGARRLICAMMEGLPVWWHSLPNLGSHPSDRRSRLRSG